MIKKVVVLYYTQSGQLKQAVDATLEPLQRRSTMTVEYIQLKPVRPFPFPWGFMEFFGAFADTVQGKPCELEPVPDDLLADTDLFVLAYQPWFLTISQPMHSFLQSVLAERMLGGKPVVTIVACRNMWINAQETIKARLQQVGADLVGHIAYTDPAPNLISLITVVAYVMGGIKGRLFGLFPTYGFRQSELEEKSGIYGDCLARAVETGDYTGLEQQLLQHGAVHVISSLMVMEGRGKILFPLYARFLTKNGKANPAQKSLRVAIFGVVLPLLILVLSPILTVVAWLMPVISPDKMKKEISYYQHVAFRHEPNLPNPGDISSSPPSP